MKQPIDNIVWLDVTTLKANDYNPNHVIFTELQLLKLSLLRQGWIQPILITADRVIIDGFHRHLITKQDAQVNAMTGGKVPCAILDVTEHERMLLTVRINRAKGTHSAVKMHELIYKLHFDMGVPVNTLCDEIGADRTEIDLLLKKTVFDKLDTPNHVYSEAWTLAKVEK